VAALLIIQTLLLSYSGYIHSPIWDEPGHMVAGLSNWRFGRFDVYNVNPPVVRMVAALPVVALGYFEDWSSFYEGPGARPEFKMGEDFVRANGERSLLLFTVARWACIPFSWIGTVICYLWARDLYGRPAGLLASSFWCFEPNILAHASLITPDAHATALGLAACYIFWRWLEQPCWGRAVLTGVVNGVAQLTKSTLILLYLVWPLMWLFYRWPERYLVPKGKLFREAGMMSLSTLIGLYVMNLGYGFEGSLTQLKDFRFVSSFFTGEEIGSQSTVQGHQSGNRFAHSWLGRLPVPFPKNYLLGIDVQQRSFEDYHRPSYLRGEWRERGWWYYYLYACAIKVPLGLLSLGVLLAVVRLSGAARRLFQNKVCKRPGFSIRSKEKFDAITVDQHIDLRRNHRDELVLLLPAIAIFGVVSAQTAFSKHLRYVLPTFPYFFIALAAAARLPFNLCQKTSSLGSSMCVPPAFLRRSARRATSLGLQEWPRTQLFAAVGVTSLWLWFVASSVWIFPHSLAYFNESVGGPINGSKHLLGSNVDWGQDLRYLQRWHKENVGKEPLYVYPMACEPLIHVYGLNPLPVHKWDSTVSQRVRRCSCAISPNLLPNISSAEKTSANTAGPMSRDQFLSSIARLPPFGTVGYSLYIFPPLESKVAGRTLISNQHILANQTTFLW